MKEVEWAVEVVLRSDIIHGAIIVGPAGVGKSRTVREVLNRSGRDFVVLNTRVTALGLFRVLEENPEGVIIIDDVPELLNDPRAVSLLKAALDTEPERTITYNSMRENRSVVVKSKVIIILNEEDLVKGESLYALKNRCLYVPVYPSFQELKSKITKALRERGAKKRDIDHIISMLPYPSIRLALKYYEIHHLNKKLLPVVVKNEDPELSLIKELVSKMSVSQACREYMKMTGRSRRTFFYKLRKIKGGGEGGEYLEVQKC